MNDIEATIIYCKDRKYLLRRINYISDFTCGVYVLIKDSGRMYIGASSNLKGRLLFHSKVNGPRVTLRMTDKLD